MIFSRLSSTYLVIEMVIFHLIISADASVDLPVTRERESTFSMRIIRSLGLRGLRYLSPYSSSPSSPLRPHLSSYTPSPRLFSSAPVRKEFEAETSKLLDIVAKSLYSDSEVFVRELISNACDALEKRRIAELDGGTTSYGEVRIGTNDKDKTIVFEDNGIGMNKDELISYLGTIAHSGSKAFIEEKGDRAQSVIGQFGVGFYSAFMVADRVEVATRKLGEDKGLRWTWAGGNSYEIEESIDTEEGTKITLHLKPGDSAQFSNEERVKKVIEKYSYFLNAPLLVNGQRVNSLNAIWTATPSTVRAEDHEAFFNQLTRMHHPHLQGDRATYHIHYKADSPMSISSIMYIPSHRVSNLEFSSLVDDYGLSLYARRVLIKAKAKELLPRYFRFVVGVVDCEDIPLNLSREMLQNDPVVNKLRRVLTDKIISYLVQQQKKDVIKYTEFYRNNSLFLKEGVVVEESQSTKEELSELLMFESSSHKGGVLTSLAQYVNRLQEGQKDIYYMFAPSRQLAETSPYFEMVKGEGKEVIFLFDQADEFVFLSLSQYKGHNLVSVEKWASEKGVEEKHGKVDGVEEKELFQWVKTTLGSVKGTVAIEVTEVKGSRRTSEHPVMISVNNEMGAARQFLRMGESKGREVLVYLKPTLHLHLSHPLIQGLIKLRKTDPKTAQLLLEQMYDNALLTAGLLTDTRDTVGRMNELLTKLIGQEKSSILTP